MNITDENKEYIPICNKLNLTIEEASQYSGIGTKRLRDITDSKDCDFVMYVGNSKKLIKRLEFEKWNSKTKNI